MREVVIWRKAENLYLLVIRSDMKNGSEQLIVSSKLVPFSNMQKRRRGSD